MSKLFQTTKQNVSLHARNIFEDGELVEHSIVKESLTAQIEGKRDLFALSSEHKRRADIPVRQAGWKTRPPLKAILEGIRV